MRNLEPCPFCGNRFILIEDTWSKKFVVFCSACNAQIVADSENEAITLWNTRGPNNE